MMIVDNADIKIKQITLGKWNTNAYVVICPGTGESVLVDAPADAARIKAELQGTSLKYILMTHGHMDHTAALAGLKGLHIPLAAHQAEAATLPCPIDVPLENGDVIAVGKLRIRVLHTPGHTPGSLCFLVNSHMLCGDTIFPGGPGNTSSSADFLRVVKSIKDKILSLPEDIQLHPGHGESTNIENAKREYAVFISKKHREDICGDVLWLSS